MRRASWDARLGFLAHRTVLRASLRGILGLGGPVPSVDVAVLRSYPLLFRAVDPESGQVIN